MQPEFSGAPTVSKIKERFSEPQIFHRTPESNSTHNSRIMKFDMDCRPFVFSLFTIHFFLLLLIGSSTGKTCDITISELKLGLQDDPGEFIELRKHCDQPLDLSAYMLVLWSGGKTQNESVNLVAKAHFSHTPCLRMTGEYFLLSSPNPQTSERQANSDICYFDQLGLNWIQGLHFWVNMGNERTNAIVLYNNSANKKLNVGDLLTAENAYRESIVDLVFYGNKAGERIRGLLFPDYFVGKPGSEQNDYFRLNPKALKESNENGPSFSFCCTDEAIIRQWPLAFKVAKATPGSANTCSNATWVLDPKESHFRPETVDRCSKAAVENLHSEEDTSESWSHSPIVSLQTVTSFTDTEPESEAPKENKSSRAAHLMDSWAQMFRLILVFVARTLLM